MSFREDNFPGLKFFGEKNDSLNRCYNYQLVFWGRLSAIWKMHGRQKQEMRSGVWQWFKPGANDARTNACTGRKPPKSSLTLVPFWRLKITLSSWWFKASEWVLSNPGTRANFFNWFPICEYFWWDKKYEIQEKKQYEIQISNRCCNYWLSFLRGNIGHMKNTLGGKQEMRPSAWHWLMVFLPGKWGKTLMGLYHKDGLSKDFVPKTIFFIRS